MPALLRQLGPRLPLLTGGARDLPRRQQTMRDTIAWSYDLLAPSVQALFRRISVFVGGFGLDGAEAIRDRVMAASGIPPPGPPLEVVDGITALIEQSLLLRTTGPGDEPRYRMLETVREFGLDRLRASGEEREVRAAHAAYVQTVADLVPERLFSPEFERVVARLDADHDNVRAALAWAAAADEPEVGLRLAGAMIYYWLVRGGYREGHRHLARALARATRTPSP
ncbi:MAG: LuxR family transcriptional regulator, partial [Chloroflexota bacterium]|nr:LuxR family transcriptional regulator [Chloroflexota bacterium]